VRAHDALRAGTRSTGVGRVRRAAEALVVAQVALAAVSLVAAALVGRSLVRLQGVDLAFAPERLLVATMTMRQDQLAAPPQQRAALDQVLERTRALPGVRDVAPAFASPFAAAGGGIDGKLPKPGQGKEEAAENPVLNMEVAAPNHFAVLGVPVRRGRTFRADDGEGAAPVIVVSESVARHYWPGGDAVGQRLAMGPRELTVVGVVADTRYRELTTPRATVYFPLAQSPFPMVPTTLLVRTAGDPATLVPALRRAIAESSPGTTMVTATPLEVLLDAPRAQPRLNAGVLALFAAAAVSLAAIGLFAVVATMVRQRTHELGIRMALGATAGDVRRLVLGRGLALAAIGAALGLAGALAAGRLVASLLYETSPTDAPTLVAVVATLLVVAALASLLPARVGARVDPAGVLRGDE
jgi:putative ABC transport system permease protein